MSRPIVLVALLAAAASLAGAGCASRPGGPAGPLVVLSQTPSNPLAGKPVVRVMPLDEVGSMEARYFAARAASPPPVAPSPPLVAPLPPGPSALAMNFAAAVARAGAAFGVRVVGESSAEVAGFLAWPKVMFVGERGPGREPEVHLRVRVTTTEGVLVDEIALRSWSPKALGAPMDAPDPIGEDPATQVGTLMVQYLHDRSAAPRSSVGPCIPGSGRAVEAPPPTTTTEGERASADAARFWTAWKAAHGPEACAEASAILKADARCEGPACRGAAILASGYPQSCQPGPEERIAIHRDRKRWEEEAGTGLSRCLAETYRALVAPAGGFSLAPACAGEAPAERALRSAVIAAAPHSVAPTPPAVAPSAPVVPAPVAPAPPAPAPTP